MRKERSGALDLPIDHATPDDVIVNGIKVIEAMKRAQTSGRSQVV